MDSGRQTNLCCFPVPTPFLPLSVPCGQMNGRAGGQREAPASLPSALGGGKGPQLYRRFAWLNLGRKEKQLYMLFGICEASFSAVRRWLLPAAMEVQIETLFLRVLDKHRSVLHPCGRFTGPWRLKCPLKWGLWHGE